MRFNQIHVVRLFKNLAQECIENLVDMYADLLLFFAHFVSYRRRNDTETSLLVSRLILVLVDLFRLIFGTREYLSQKSIHFEDGAMFQRSKQQLTDSAYYSIIEDEDDRSAFEESDDDFIRDVCDQLDQLKNSFHSVILNNTSSPSEDEECAVLSHSIDQWESNSMDGQNQFLAQSTVKDKEYFYQFVYVES